MRECRRHTATSPPWAQWLAPDAAPEGGSVPSPGADAVVDALSAADPDPAQVRHAITVFAWERVATSPDLACAMDDVNDLWTVLEDSGGTPISRDQARHALVDAWVDAVAAERGSPGVDPLSGLHTVGYLYGRVHELDRMSDDAPTPLVMLVVRWPAAAGPWGRIARIMQVAAALRTCVRQDATLSQVGTTMAVALVPDDAGARLERHALTKAIETGELSTARVRVDVFAVPDARSRLPEIVTRLHEEANVDHVPGSPSSRHSGTGPLD